MTHAARSQSTRGGARRSARAGSSRLAAVLVVVLAIAGSLLVASPAVAAYSKSPPSGLKASDTSNTSIVLTWKRISGVNRYAIQYSSSSRFSNPKYAVPTGVGTQAEAFRSINGLEPSTRYYFRIRGTNDSGSKNLTDWSKTYARTTGTYVYGAPSAPKASNPRADSVDLTWGEIPNAGMYRVEYTPKSGEGAGTLKYAYPTDNKMTLTELRKNQAYNVRVRALEGKVDSDGNPYLLTGYSKSSTITTSAFTTGPATGLAVTGASLDKIDLRWNPVEGATAYRVQYWTSTKDIRYLTSTTIPAGAPGTSFNTAGSPVTATLTRFCDESSCAKFTPGKTYAFRVTALRDGERINDYTDDDGVKVMASKEPLSHPIGFRVESTTNSSITLSWPVVPGADQYYLQSRAGSSKAKDLYTMGLCASVACTETDGRKYVTLSSLGGAAVKASTDYYLRIVSADAQGVRRSEYDPSYTKTTTMKYRFAAPVMGGSVPSTYSITVNWYKVDGAPAYAIERSKDSEFKKIDGTTCVVPPTTDPPSDGSGRVSYSKSIDGLAKEESYFFRTRVVSSCAKGYSTQSELSGAVSARTQARVGSLSGTVTRGSGDVIAFGEAVKTMTATAYAGSCSSTGYDVASTTHVEDDGTWRISGLREGSYCVLLSQVGQSNFTSPWVTTDAAWNDERRKFKTMATTQTVTGTGTKAVGDQPIGPGVTVSGTVRGQKSDGSQTALGGVTITLTGGPLDNGSEREVREVVTTATDGSYSVSGLFPGKYRVNLVKSGWTPWEFWVRHLEDRPTYDVKLCATSSCTATPGKTQFDN